MLRRLFGGSVMESLGLAELGLGAGLFAAAALLLLPPVRKQMAGWGGRLAQGAQDIWSEAKESPGLVVGATALAAGGAALAAAPTGGASAGAAATVAAPSTAAALPVALEGVERALTAKKLVKDLTEDDGPKKA